MLDKLLLKDLDQIILDIDLKKKKRKPKDKLFEYICESRETYLETSIGSIDADSIEIIDELDPTFTETLFKIIDDRGLKDSDVYNKVGIDRKLFSKIRNGQKITKNNAINLCIALELNIKDTEDLLMKAGFALSKSVKRDAIIRFCIEHEIYKVDDIDSYLLHYEQKPIIKYE